MYLTIIKFAYEILSTIIFKSKLHKGKPNLTGELGASCNPKPICGGDGSERSTRLLLGLEDLMKSRPFGSEGSGHALEGKRVLCLPGNSARPGREQRYAGLLMLKGCGIEKNRGVPFRTSGPIGTCSASSGMVYLNEFKIVQDPLNGPIKVEGIFLKLLDSPEIQRLRNIKALGMCNLVFPEANHTRFSHSLGTFFLVDQLEKIWKNVDLTKEKIAAFLHDIGHYPFSHTFEEVLKEATGLSHEDTGSQIIEGKGNFRNSVIPAIIESEGYDPRDISGMIHGSISSHRTGLEGLISGPLDMDEVDYLRRDAMFCGVSLGMVDYSRILNTVQFQDGELVVQEKGLPSLESLAINRVLMFRSVYFHKTVRIAQKMMEKSLSRIPRKNLSESLNMNDYEFIELIKKFNETRNTWNLIKLRKLYKLAAKVPFTNELFDRVNSLLSESETGRNAIVDVIPPFYFNGPGRLKTDQPVQIGNKTVPLSDASPIVKSLSASVNERTIYVSCRESEVIAVRQILESL